MSTLQDAVLRLSEAETILGQSATNLQEARDAASLCAGWCEPFALIRHFEIQLIDACETTNQARAAWREAFERGLS